jgi:TonB family protein
MLLALAAAVVMRWVAPSARARYFTGVATLTMMLAVPVGTFLVLQWTSPMARTEAAHELVPVQALNPGRPDAVIEVTGGVPSAPASDRVLPALVLFWLSGVLVLSARLLGGWAVARRLATTTRQPVPAEVEELAARVANRLGLRQLVRMAESSVVTVPIVIGWLKPVVLVPTAAVAGLSPAHLEALLAHELAHVRRHDYLVNLLQSAIETLLFYHPGVWWVSGRVRQEREHCCDDEAVAVCDRFVYVNALTDLAAMTMHTRLALAATDGSLLRRIRRLLANKTDERPAAGWLSIGVVVMFVAALTPAVPALGGGDQQAAAVPPSAAAPATAVAAPGPRAAARSVAVPASGAAIAFPAPAAAMAAPTSSALPPNQQSGTSAERERQKEIERGLDAISRQLSVTEAELASLARQRRQVDDDRAREEIRLRREAAVEKLAALRKELETAIVRHEIGVAQENVVNDARAQVATAERELRSIEVEARGREAASALDARREDAEREYVRLQQERGAALARAAVAGAEASASPAAQLADQQGVYTVGGNIREPKLLTRVEPVYPAVAKAAKMQGPVYIEAIIGRDGHVREAKPVGGAPFPPLREAALAAVQQWVYTPTVVNGEPVEVQLSIQIIFKLDTSQPSAASRLPETSALLRARAAEQQTPAFPVADPATQVRAADLLVVDIAGEDQLPRWFVVETGGTIRLPLIGRFTVVDLTATQVRDAIARALTERKLAEGRTVTVVIHRPR